MKLGERIDWTNHEGSHTTATIVAKIFRGEDLRRVIIKVDEPQSHYMSYIEIMNMAEPGERIEEYFFDNEEEATAHFKDKLKGTRVFLVLDDIAPKEEINVGAGELKTIKIVKLKKDNGKRKTKLLGYFITTSDINILLAHKLKNEVTTITLEAEKVDTSRISTTGKIWYIPPQPDLHKSEKIWVSMFINKAFTWCRKGELAETLAQLLRR